VFDVKLFVYHYHIYILYITKTLFSFLASTIVFAIKPNYRKDYRAMSPISGALKNFESLTTPTATFPEIMSFVPINAMNVRTKFEVRILSAPEIGPNGD